MGQYINDAIMVIKESAMKIGLYIDRYADNPDDNAGIEDAPQRLYRIAAELQVQASQLGQRRDSCEGTLVVKNTRSTVQIGDEVIRGDIAFEIQKDGKWIKGHRENSQYGQVFIGHDGTSEILTDSTYARITHPLEMDH